MRPMWTVLMNGVWQRAEHDGVVIDWIARGWVGPATMVKHASWPTAHPLATVPAFAAHLPAITGPTMMPGRAPNVARAGRGADVTTGRTLLAIFAVLAALIIGPFIATLFWFWGSYGASWGAAVLAVAVAFPTVLVVGRVVSSSPAPLKAVAHLAFDQPAAPSIIMVCMFIGGGFGLSRGVAASNARARALEECSVAVVRATAAKRADRNGLPLAQAQMELAEAKNAAMAGAGVCSVAGETAKASFLRDAGDAAERDIVAGERQAAAERERARVVAAEAAARKKVEAFPETAGVIRSMIKAAGADAASGRWMDADARLDTARKMIKEYAGTAIASTSEWQSLRDDAEAVRARIAPQVERLARERAAKEAAIARTAAEKEAAGQRESDTRGPEPKMWLNGACLPVHRWLEENVDGYDFVSTTQPQIEGPYWTVLTVFRGRNAFGGLVTTVKRFYMQREQVVRMSDP